MKAGKYTIQDFFVNRYLQQVVIPEIQRDYVWQAEQLRGLFDSLQADFRKFLAFQPTVQAPDQALTAAFAEFQRQRSHSASLGFVYAYSDAELPGRYFLIDGQQRLTSVLLLLLALAHRRPELRDPFRRIFYSGNHLRLDYHVREASHDFLGELVRYLLSEAPVVPPGAITDQVWYYGAARTDQTISHLIQNAELLLNWFEAPEFQQLVPAATDATTAGEAAGSPEAAFFNYLTRYTEFYYFDTNLSEQGEDLYIYMNARGEQMQPNENVKADLLSCLNTSKKKEVWGKKWEDWQDFFWQHRASSGGPANENADAGFNEFLACVAGLTRLLHKPDLLLPTGASQTSRLLAALQLPTGEATLQNIERYIKCLRFLEDNRRTFAADYAYSAWLDTCLRAVWKFFNKETTDWFAKNPSTERNPMTIVWPVLRFMAQHNDLTTLSVTDTFRVLRQQYVRYHNYNRSVTQLEAEAAGRRRDGVFSTILDDEQAKHALYRAVAASDPAQVRRYEEIIWKIEDHPYNLNGRDLGNTNLTHVLTLTPTTSLDELQKVRDKFYELFPLEKASHKQLQTLLLYYGPYEHQKESSWWYSNYNFGSWRRTIRGRGSKEENVRKDGEKTLFQQFFLDFLNENTSVDEMLLRKSSTPLSRTEAINDHLKVLWYSQLLKNKMWTCGDYVAFRSDWAGTDDNFPDSPIIYSTSGDMRRWKEKLQELSPTAVTN